MLEQLFVVVSVSSLVMLTPAPDMAVSGSAAFLSPQRIGILQPLVLRRDLARGVTRPSLLERRKK
jgi:hypothetical protein